jgi:hypothetical protein
VTDPSVNRGGPAAGGSDWLVELEALCAGERPSPLQIVAVLRGSPRYQHGAIAAAARVSGLAWGTISAYRWTAARVPVSAQRNDLTLAHHRAVAKLPIDDQLTRLAEAAAENLSAAALRRRIEAGGS